MAWFLMQSIEHAHLHAWIEPMRNAGRENVPGLGQPTDSLLAFNGAVCELHFELDQWTRRGEVIMREVMAAPSWLGEVVRESSVEISRLRKLVDALATSDYRRASLEALARMVGEFFAALKSCHMAGLPIVILETRHELWTNYVRQLVAHALKRCGLPADELPSVFSTLTTPERPSARVREKLARGKLFKLARADKAFIDLLKIVPEPPEDLFARKCPGTHAALAKHHERFWWIPYMYQGPGWGMDHFLRELTTMLESDADPQELRDRIRQASLERENLEASLSLTADERSILALTRRLMFVKDARKDATYFAFANSEGFWQTVAHRIGRPLRLTRMLLPEEVISGLWRRADVPDEATLVARLDGLCVQYTGGQECLLVGRHSARALSNVISEEERPAGDGNELKGTCAVPGYAVGTVKIVNSPEEGREMHDGQILVSVATDPSLEPVMLRAAAIVTDMGGITCHAAIVSRELGTPCVVGTRFASQMLRDGEMVEVDATKGVIRRISS